MWRLFETKDLSQCLRSSEASTPEGPSREIPTSAPLFDISIAVVEDRSCTSIRRKEATISCQDCDCDLWHSSDFMHQARKPEIRILVHGIELLWDVEGYDCYLALDLEGYFVGWCHVCGILAN